MKAARAFTLVEILIVVVLLGVLAALPYDVALLRRFVMVYTSHHLEVAPGYPSGNPTATPTNATFIDQATLSSNARGQTAAPGTAGYNFGPYLSRIPVNPLNNLDTVQMIPNGESFPAVADGRHGWVFKPETGEIRPGNLGANERGVAYYDY